MEVDAFNATKNSRFTPNTKNDWLEAAKIELGSKKNIESLLFKHNGLIIEPYYDNSTTSNIYHSLAESNDSYFGKRKWHNKPCIVVYNALDANKQALALLNAGADGILFQLTEKVDAELLLHSIDQNYCSISFIASKNDFDFFLNYTRYLQSKNFEASKVEGEIFWTEFPVNFNELVKAFDNWESYRPIGIICEPKDTIADEVSSALYSAVKILDRLTLGNYDIVKLLSSIAFSLSVGRTIFIEIAKLKTLRLLVRELMRTYFNSFSGKIFIHGNCHYESLEAYEPNSNMIANAIGGLTAVFGGCDSFTIKTTSASNLETRIATNVSTILREESYLSHEADGTAGSYYLENLVEQLSSQAWESFLVKVSNFQP